MQSALGKPAVADVWNSAVAMPTNSFIKYHAYFEEDQGQTMVFAEWQHEGSTTLTHSDMVTLCADFIVHTTRRKYGVNV